MLFSIVLAWQTISRPPLWFLLVPIYRFEMVILFPILLYIIRWSSLFATVP